MDSIYVITCTTSTRDSPRSINIFSGKTTIVTQKRLIANKCQIIVNNLDLLCEDVRSKASLARFQALMLKLVDITKLSCMYTLPKLVDIAVGTHLSTFVSPIPLHNLKYFSTPPVSLLNSSIFLSEPLSL